MRRLNMNTDADNRPHTETSELLKSEMWDSRQMSLSSQGGRTYVSLQDIARALLRSPGRFRSPLAWHERLKLLFTVWWPGFDPLKLANHFLREQVNAVPDYPWQVLIRYLVREGVIASPGNFRASFAHSDPKYHVARFLLKLTRGEPTTGTGNSLDFETALSKGIGESLERFFLMANSVYSPRVTRHASVKRLEKHRVRFLHPESLTQFTTEQRQASPRLAFTDTTEWAWAAGAQVGDRRSILIPAHCVSFGHFGSRGRRDPVLRDRNSNAAAGGFTLVEALVSGIHEAIERDGFMIFWLNRIAPPVLDVSACSDRDFQRLLERVNRCRLEAIFLNITSDIGVPAVTCALIDRGAKGPSLCIGSSCGTDIPHILRRALFEALSVQRGREDLTQSYTLDNNYEPFVDAKIDLGRRVRIWKDPTNFHRFEFFLSGSKQTLAEAFGESRHFASSEDELEYLRARLASMGPGYEIYYHEHRHRILDRIGYHVVKVIIPELVHLYLNENRACLGAKRLRTVPPKLGYAVAKEWNPWPHPFP